MAEKNREPLNIPWVTLSIVGVLAVVFYWEMRAPGWDVLAAIFEDYGFRWSRFMGHPWREAPTLISASLLHADRWHIGGNVIFFLLFAPSVERSFGPTVFFLSYLFWAVVSGLIYGYFSPFSSVIGASGAISGAAGAFFVLHPLRMPVGLKKPERPLAHFSLLSQILQIIGSVPALFYVGLWFLFQLKFGFYSLQPHASEGPFNMVAYWAHIGGFAAGALTAFLFLTLKDSSNPRLSK